MIDSFKRRSFARIIELTRGPLLEIETERGCEPSPTFRIVEIGFRDSPLCRQSQLRSGRFLRPQPRHFLQRLDRTDAVQPKVSPTVWFLHFDSNCRLPLLTRRLLVDPCFIVWSLSVFFYTSLFDNSWRNGSFYFVSFGTSTTMVPKMIFVNDSIVVF